MLVVFKYEMYIPRAYFERALLDPIIIVITGLNKAFALLSCVFASSAGSTERKTPSVVVHDPDLLRDILVKNFAAFPNRQVRFLDILCPLH